MGIKTNFLGMELNIEAFDPTEAELTSIVAETKKVTEESGMEVVKETRTKLVKARRRIEVTGKAMRDDANKFAKAVIAREKELVSIIEPEELRLKEIEAEVERRAVLEARKQALPVRIAALESIGDNVEYNEDMLLEMDDNAFTLYKAERITAWQEKETARLAEEQRKIDEEKARIAREQELEETKKRAGAEAEERAKREADERVRRAEQAQADAERKVKEAEERAEREKKEAVEREERERVEAEKKEAAERKRLEKMAKYRTFRAESGWTEETKADYREENTGTEIVLWKKVGTFTL